MRTIPHSWIIPIRLIYTYAFNLYAWYLLYKIIWVLPFDWENIIAWVFGCFGMWFFVLDSNDKKYRKEMSKTIGYPDLTDN
jgi:hypothetical protein